MLNPDIVDACIWKDLESSATLHQYDIFAEYFSAIKEISSDIYSVYEVVKSLYK